MTAKLLRGLFGVAMVGFLLLPLLVILPLAFTSSLLLIYPIPSFSLRWFTELLSDPVWRRSIANSLFIGSCATALATVLGLLAALGLRWRPPIIGTFALTLFMLPMVVPTVVLGIGMQMLMARLGLANSYAAVIIAHTVVAIPFVVISISGSLAGIDRRTEQAASSLGANPVQVLFRVTLPLSTPGILSGAVLAFATSLDEVVLTLFVAGPNQRTLARQMFASIRDNISPIISAAAFFFIGGTLLVAALVALARRESMRRRTAPG